MVVKSVILEKAFGFQVLKTHVEETKALFLPLMSLKNNVENERERERDKLWKKK